ncbi:MAG: hypothetical protein M1820_002063 [Bogoriella megaspora]|nr:MAG: hypothetical protein M1820_002063 [Bogoriella megaspora]
MKFCSLAAAAALATSVQCAVLNVPHVVHEKREVPTRHWTKRSTLEKDAVLPMRIGMTQSNLDRGDELLMEIAHHESPKYGQWYTPEEIVELFAPSKDTVSSVRSWLESAGIASERISQSANKQWMQFDATVEEAESLLRTEYSVYEHGVTGRKHIACDEYHIPAHVQKHVDYVTPGLRLVAGGKISTPTDSENDLEKRKFLVNGANNEGTYGTTTGSSHWAGPLTLAAVNSTVLANLTQNQLFNCDLYATPACIKREYNITTPTKAAAGNQLGIFEEGDFYAAQDLVDFYQAFATNIPTATRPQLEGIDGGTAPSPTAGGESDLDFQISYPIIYPQNSVLFQTDDLPYATGRQPSGGFLNTFFDGIDGSYCTFSAYGETGDSSIDPKYPDPASGGFKGQRQCGVYKPANVISISYGAQEDDFPTNYQQRQCAEIMKLGMQGVSVILASGDSGVAARGSDAGNADGCLGTGQVFNPDFPASCPFLTAVGGTVLTGDVNKDQEVAVTRFPSGGGFSNIYPRQSYQNAALTSYFANHDPGYASYNISGTNNPTRAQYGNGIYNKGGRGYPDVSAVGDNVVIFLNGRATTIGGTSASAPVFAAILNRINEERIAVGKSTVGFVNPTLYANPQAFNDITTGTNPGCRTQGFSAVPGWDPVTGLGTPNYPALLSVFLALP